MDLFSETIHAELINLSMISFSVRFVAIIVFFTLVETVLRIDAASLRMIELICLPFSFVSTTTKTMLRNAEIKVRITNLLLLINCIGLFLVRL